MILKICFEGFTLNSNNSLYFFDISCMTSLIIVTYSIYEYDLRKLISTF